MELNCQNCDELITENFCGNCGQKKYKRIDKKYILDEIQYTFLHTNKGFLYSIKNIIKNPGKTAREFIDGNRVNHYKPILLAFLLSGISAFISFKIIGLNKIASNYYTAKHINSAFMNDYMSITSSYNSIIMLILVPFIALFTKVSFSSWKHNYYEHVIINAYVLSFYMVFGILFVYPLMFLFKDNLDYFPFLTNLPILALLFVLVWFFKEFYSNMPLTSVIGRVAISVILTIIGIMLIMFLIMIAIFFIKGPEAANYFIPTDMQKH